MTNIVFVGEAYGKEEAEQGKPFVGPSGRVLNWLLHQAGIARGECYLTNVFNLRPQPKNDVLNLCGPKSEGIPGRPFLQRSKYVRAEYAPELDRLYEELEREKPNVIVALGATASWAILNTSGIRNIRGYITESKWGKVLPTFHPAAVMRQWELHPIVIMDLQKALRQSEFPEIRRPKHELWIEPTIDDLTAFYNRYLESADIVAADIETVGDRITCIGFGISEAAIVIPFFDQSTKDHNYWPSLEQEVLAWKFVRFVLNHKKILFQNGMYDMTFLWRAMGITTRGFAEDTMLAHHAQEPGMQKSLDFLGSIYSEELSWKHMRKNSTVKKED